MKITNKILFPILFILITACSNSSRYQHANDSTPTRLPNQAELKDALPRAEAYSRGGNKNYQVWGVDYQVLDDATGFEQTGIASWYGRKFHGHLTSNGEIYDMYAMSAAHKNLPLPSYLKVTNLANNKSVIVRVNDRGPFHQDRIIDLSYSAAYKLDILKTGTARVKITAITTFNKTNVNKAEANKASPHTKQQTTNVGVDVDLGLGLGLDKKNYIQVFATSKLDLAQSTANTLTKQYSQMVNYPEKNGVYRIQIGPILDNKLLNKLLLELKQGQYPNAYLRSL